MDFEYTDNGFLQLDHVRIPRENMLSRFAQVEVWGVCRHALPGERMVVPRRRLLALGLLHRAEFGAFLPQRGASVPQTFRLKSCVIWGKSLGLSELSEEKRDRTEDAMHMYLQ